MTGMFCPLKTPVLQHTHAGYSYPRGDGRFSRRPAQVPGAGLPGGSSPRSHRGCLSVCPGVTAAGRLRLWRAARPAPWRSVLFPGLEAFLCGERGDDQSCCGVGPPPAGQALSPRARSAAAQVTAQKPLSAASAMSVRRPSALPVRCFATASDGMTSKAAEVTAIPAGDCPGLAWMMRSLMLSTARYDARQRPWIAPDAASAALVAEVIRRCPSGALHYQAPGIPREQLDVPTTIRTVERGPFLLRGDLRIQAANSWVTDTRAHCAGALAAPASSSAMLRPTSPNRRACQVARKNRHRDPPGLLRPSRASPGI